MIDLNVHGSTGVVVGASEIEKLWSFHHPILQFKNLLSTYDRPSCVIMNHVQDRQEISTPNSLCKLPGETYITYVDRSTNTGQSNKMD